jgi:hypothetical protein
VFFFRAISFRFSEFQCPHRAIDAGIFFSPARKISRALMQVIPAMRFLAPILFANRNIGKIHHDPQGLVSSNESTWDDRARGQKFSSFPVRSRCTPRGAWLESASTPVVKSDADHHRWLGKSIGHIAVNFSA